MDDDDNGDNKGCVDATGVFARRTAMMLAFENEGSIRWRWCDVVVAME